MSQDKPEPRPAPRHVAIIMDGNGRWARARGRPRSAGHQAGVEAVRRAVRGAESVGLQYLTVFGFSTENWNRPRAEVDALFELLKRYIDKDLDQLAERGVKIKILGDRDTLTPDLMDIVHRAEARTADNTKHVLSIAFNYGGRDEILRAARRLAHKAAAGDIDPEAIDQAAFEDVLDTRGLPDPDLVIRTSGEERLSNFLIWQSAYSEFYSIETLWPDFSEDHLKRAIEAYRTRERRFGGLSNAAA